MDWASRKLHEVLAVAKGEQRKWGIDRFLLGNSSRLYGVYGVTVCARSMYVCHCLPDMTSLRLTNPQHLEAVKKVVVPEERPPETISTSDAQRCAMTFALFSPDLDLGQTWVQQWKGQWLIDAGIHWETRRVAGFCQNLGRDYTILHLLSESLLSL